MANKKKENYLMSKLTTETRDEFIERVQEFIRDEHDLDLGEFEVEELLNFFCETAGSYFYNSGIEDSMKQAESSLNNLTDDISQLRIVD